jgi:hypothetical protein
MLQAKGKRMSDDQADALTLASAFQAATVSLSLRLFERTSWTVSTLLLEISD